MPKRTQEELSSHPCFFKLKDFDRPNQNQKPSYVKQMVPKLDENGNPVFKEIEVKVKKSCGCKNKDGTPQMETIKQKVPDTQEITVEVAPNNEENKMVICKLFGTVKRSHCETCHTYKTKHP